MDRKVEEELIRDGYRKEGISGMVLIFG